MVLGGGLGRSRPAAIERRASAPARAALQRHLRTLRATLLGALLTAPLALTTAAPSAADGLAAPPLLIAPDAPAFDAARRAQLARNALYFLPGDDEPLDDEDVFPLPAPLPWPPGAGERSRTLSVPAGKPLFLLAALAPGNTGFNGPATVSLDGASLGNVLPYAVRGIPVSDGAQQREHAALALVLAAPPPGRHTLEVACGLCAPANGAWLSLINGGRRIYTLDVQPPIPAAQPAALAQSAVTTLPAAPAIQALPALPALPEPPLALPAHLDPFIAESSNAYTVALVLEATAADVEPVLARAPAPILPPPSAPPVAVPARVVTGVLDRRVYSQALGRELPYRVYLPAGYDAPTSSATPAGAAARRYPVLYLLHGLGAGYRQFSNLGLDGELERQSVQAIVVAPSGRAGYWVNHADGGPRWADYVVQDLVAHVDATYRTIPLRESRAIGGISMGAHGALQLALNNPTLFGAVGAHSPALRARDQAPVFLGGLMMALSPTAVPPQAYAVRDPISLVGRAQQKLPIWIDIGDSDRWRARADELRLALKVKGWEYVWSPAPGDHEDAYWARRLPEYIAWYRQRLGA